MYFNLLIFSFLYSAMLFYGCNSPSVELNQEKGVPESHQGEGSPAEEVEYYKWKLWPVDTSIAYVTGNFDPAQDSVFTLIDTSKADRGGLYLRKDAYRAYLAMDSAAREEGISLQIRSATRNFDYQKSIWERKWKEGTNPDPVERALKILRYSSMPGSSRHHWGTDIDLNNFSNQYFESGEGLILYEWLQENGPKYGFRQPYTTKGEDRPEGYNEEKWHWSFYPVSDILTRFAAENLKNEMIEGFLGAETAQKIDIVQKYVLGLNPELLPN